MDERTMIWTCTPRDRYGKEINHGERISVGVYHKNGSTVARVVSGNYASVPESLRDRIADAAFKNGFPKGVQIDFLYSNVPSVYHGLVPQDLFKRN